MGRFFLAIFVILFSAGVLTSQTLPNAPESQLQNQPSPDQDKAKAQAANDPDGNAGGSAAPQNSNPPHQPDNNNDGQTRTDTPPQAGTPPSGNSDPSQAQQTKRMMWVVPNFGAVSSNTQLPPLSTRGKFKLAEEDSFDYSAFVWTGILAFQSWGLNSDPELGQDAAGYGRYYWRGFADEVSGTYFTEAIIPALTHEDPRYYTMGHGGFLRRTEYALSRTFITKIDSGGSSFNWSEVGGNGLEAGLSNAYYPPEEQGLSQTFRNWGTQMESAALNNVAKEFWPDIRRKLLRQK